MVESVLRLKRHRRIAQLVKKTPTMPAATVKAELNLSARTIRRRLEEVGLKARSSRKVPLLTERHKTNCLKFAKEHMVRPIMKWRNILWTDETKIVRFGSKGRRQYVRRPPCTEYRKQYTVKTVNHAGGNIMVWVVFLIMALDRYIEFLALWINRNTSIYLNGLCCRGLRMKCH